MTKQNIQKEILQEFDRRISLAEFKQEKKGQTEFNISKYYNIECMLIDAKDYLEEKLPDLITKAKQQEREEWLDGRRCHCCGDIKNNELSDTCGKCMEEN